MQVLASLDESDVGRIRPGQLVRFRVDAFPNDEFRGAVTQVRLQPTTIQNVVTYQTVIDVPNPELKLKPGMTANVNIEIARRQNVLRIPNTALRFRPTTEIFTALGQTPPPTGGGGRGRGAGEGPDTRNAMPGQPPAAQPQPVAQQKPERERPAARERAPEPRAASQGTPETARPADASASAAPPMRGSGDRVDAGPGSETGTGRGGDRRGGNVQERMANMTPEEREQFMARMRARGIELPTDGQTAAPQRGRGQGPRTEARAAADPPKSQGGATTFDALFPPLAPTESFGQVWLNVDGKLQRVRMRLGVTDGQQTELIQAMDGRIEEGTEVVTNVITGAVRQAVTPPGGNAFPGMEGGRGGGFGGRVGGRGQ
jgi:hypothetical protein